MPKRKVLQNRDLAETQRKNKIPVFPCEEMLGSMKPVKEFATFYVNHKVDLELVKISLLMDYCDNVLFTPDELKAYRMGLDAMFTFFKNTELDTKSYLMEAEKKNMKGVG